MSQLPRIAGMLRPATPEDPADDREIAVCDPCAADGEAIQAIARLVYPAWTPPPPDTDADGEPLAPGDYVRKIRYSYEKCDARDHHKPGGCANPECEKYVAAEIREPAKLTRLRHAYEDAVERCANVTFYTCELEATRHKALLDRFSGQSHSDKQLALHGDAFRAAVGVNARGEGVGLLYLNPPYDQDRVHGRLEERFLKRFAPAVRPGGVLAFVVPHYSLAASAETIAKSFERVTCWRFAGDAFDAYKQVVLFGRRREVDLDTADPEVVARVRAWATEAPASELPEPGEVLTSGAYEIPLAEKHVAALATWKMQVIDAAALTAKFVPWHTTQRGGKLAPLSAVLPDLSIGELMHRTYDVAVPPRPAHIAAGLAAGIFNGARIEPDDLPSGKPSGLPPLLVKGVFDREWRTIDEKHNKDGEKTSEVQVQAPKLVVTILDLAKHSYHTLATGTEKTGATAVSEMSVADLLDHYGRALMTVMERQCRILYDPRRPEDAGMVVAEAGRKPFVAHEHAVRACVKVLRDRPGAVPLLLGEIGCLRGDTPIYDPMTGEVATVAERHRRREPFHVWARGLHGAPVIAAALPPVKYPTAQMVRVTLANGDSTVVTPAHRFWGDEDWIKASEIAERLRGSVPCLLPSSSDSDLSARASGGSRWSRTTPSSPDGCLRGHYSGGERLHVGTGSDRGSAPSRAGALGQSPPSSREDATGHESGCSHACRSFAPRSTTGCAHPMEAPLLELFLPQPGSHSSNGSGSTREGLRFPQGCGPARTARGPVPVAPASTPRAGTGSVEAQHHSPGGAFGRCNQTPRPLSRSLGSSPLREASAPQEPAALLSTVSTAPSVAPFRLDYIFTEQEASVEIVSVEPVEAEPYYDFHVPVFNNYWAAGLWHHNSGKSACALLVGKTIGARRALVVCPPHLLDSWRNEVKATLPEADFRVLSSISDVEALAASDAGVRGMDAYLADCRRRWLRGDPVLADREYDQMKADVKRARAARPIVAVLSRETAKLGHGVETVSGACPRCGAALADGFDYAKKHSRCENRKRRPANAYAKLAHRLALRLRAYASTPVVRQILDGRLDEILREKRKQGVGSDEQIAAALAEAEKRAKSYAGIPADLALAILSQVASDAAADVADGGRPSDDLWHAIAWCLAAAPNHDAAAKIVPLLHDARGYDHTQHALAIAAAFLPADRAREVAAALPKPEHVSDYGPQLPTKALEAKLSALAGHNRDEMEDGGGIDVAGVKAKRKKGKLYFGADADAAAGSLQAALHLLDAIRGLSTWRFSDVCGEPLYQAVAAPRRFPLAKYIARQSDLFDYLVIDEAHEYGTSGDSAQSIAAHRLFNTLRVPTVFMTGSIMSGYASSMFPNMISASPAFREEFARNEENGFTERYGYRKRVVSDREDGEVVAFGTQSDRVERCSRDAGEAPGILPLFLFRHLLPLAVTLHKADLRIDLQPLTQERNVVAAEGEVFTEYEKLLKAVLDQIKHDRFEPDLAGRLFGQLSELGSYLDRCTVDTWADDGLAEYEVRYPEGVPRVGGKLVASARLFPAKTVLPKEAAMLDFVESEMAAGRNVMVFCWHLNLLPRIQRLVEARIKEPAAILYADKVPTAKRQQWINDKIIAKGVRVMILNPVCVSTGLNNLVYFASQWHHESPACNAIVDRQAIGRIDRIGQKLPPKVVRSYYGSTLQEKMYDLLMAKVGISLSTDGLDPTGALAAAGLADDAALTGLSIGKVLWKMYEDEMADNVVPFPVGRRAGRR